MNECNFSMREEILNEDVIALLKEYCVVLVFFVRSACFVFVASSYLLRLLLIRLILRLLEAENDRLLFVRDHPLPYAPQSPRPPHLVLVLNACRLLVPVSWL